MKFKTFKFIYLLSYQTSVWIVLAVGYFHLNIFFSMFSLFLGIIGIICTVALYLKVNKLEKGDGITVKCKLNTHWYQKQDMSVGAYFMLLLTIFAVSINLKGIFGNLLSATLALYVLFNDDKLNNISFLLFGLNIFNASLKDQNIMCIGRQQSFDANGLEVSATKLTKNVYVIRSRKV